VKIFLFILLAVFGATFLMALSGILKPNEKRGFRTRKESANTAAGSLIIICISAVFLALLPADEERQKTIETAKKPESSTPERQGLVVRDTRNDGWHVAAAQAVAKETSVVEATFPNNSSSSFWVSVRDDGSRRDGFAEYVCLLLIEGGMPKGEFVVIRVWDAAKLAASDFRELGRFECSRR
jgi:hypothetical protein